MPGAPAVVALLEKAFDTAQDTAQDQWEQRLEQVARTNAAELERLGEMLGLLAGELDSLVMQVAELDELPEAANRILRLALATDEKMRSALGRLEGIAGRFD